MIPCSIQYLYLVCIFNTILIATHASRFGLESQQLSPLLTLELKGEDIQFGLDIRDPSVWVGRLLV